MKYEHQNFWAVIRSIGDVNAEIGLNHASQAEDLYAGSLEASCRQLPAKCGQMAGSLGGGDLNGFSVLVHAVKSEMATVGAMGLSGTAAKLEAAAKNGDMDFCRERFPAFRGELLRLHERLSAAFPPAEAAAKEGPGSPEALREGVGKALAAIEDYDGDLAIESVNPLLAFDFGGETNALLRQAAEALADFDYKDAGNCLRGIP